MSRGIRSFSCVCRASKAFILCLSIFVLGNTGSVKFTFTHASHSHTLHTHARVTLTHASHSHTLHTHTRFTFTHASHSHTRQPFRIVPHICLLISVLGNTGSVKFTFGNPGNVKFTFTHASHSHTLHTHTRFTFTRFTFTHASHSHTLHITHASHHTRFPFTHASHSHTHTRQPFRLVPHIVLVCLAKGNTGSVRFTFTHAHTRDSLFDSCRIFAC